MVKMIIPWKKKQSNRKRIAGGKIENMQNGKIGIYSYS